MKPRNKTLKRLQKRLDEGDERVYERTIKRMIKEIANRDKPKQKVRMEQFENAGLRHLLN